MARAATLRRRTFVGAILIAVFVPMFVFAGRLVTAAAALHLVRFGMTVTYAVDRLLAVLLLWFLQELWIIDLKKKTSRKRIAAK